MTSRPHNQRCLLATLCSIKKIGQIIRKDLKGIQQIVKILYLGDRTQPAQGSSNAVAYYGTFPDTCIRHPELAIFGLKTSKALAHIPYFTHVLTYSKDPWIPGQHAVKTGLQYLSSIYPRGVRRIFCRYFRN